MEWPLALCMGHCNFPIYDADIIIISYIVQHEARDLYGIIVDVINSANT